MTLLFVGASIIFLTTHDFPIGWVYPHEVTQEERLMQPKNVPVHVRIKVEPTIKQRGRPCRLHGKDFKSIADAARYFNVNYSWAAEQVQKGMNRENFPKKYKVKKDEMLAL